MLMPGEESRALEGRHERLDALLPQAPPCADGHRFFCDEAWAGIADKLKLSHRQVEIIRCVLTGEGDRQIARRLDLSLHTVQTHIKRLHEKLAIQSRVELAARIFAAYRAWRIDSHPPAGCPQNSGLAPV